MEDEIEDDGDARPRDQRDSLFLSCMIEISGGRSPVTVRVRNLSPGGMMIDGNSAFYEGAHLKTELRGVGMITGRIAWVAPERAGVAFDEPIDPRLARTQIGSKAPPERDRYGQVRY